MKQPKQGAFSRIESALRGGELGEAQRLLSNVKVSTVSRSEALALASLARRAERPEMGLAFLGSIVRRQRRRGPPASTAELAEYAEALNRVGASQEAMSRLKQLDADGTPIVAFYLASALTSQWDYGEAIPWLEKYLEHERDPYARFVARLNLAASLVVVRRDTEAEVLLEELRAESCRNAWFRLQGNTLHVCAMQAIERGEWVAAERYILEARRMLGGRAAGESLLVEKWHALLLLHRDGATRASLEAVQTVRERAIRGGYWEIWRDCDRNEARVTRNHELSARVFHGTPFPAFRRQFAEELEEKIADYYDWEPPGGEGSGKALSLQTGEWGGNRTSLVPGSIPSRMAGALCSDLYRPVRLGELYARTYPEELYNPETSPLRVHQTLRRLRRAFEAQEIPLLVQSAGNACRLFATAPIRVRLELALDSHFEKYLQPLRQRWPERSFSSREVQSLLALQLRVVQRALRWGESNGRLIREGVGKSTRYRFRA